MNYLNNLAIQTSGEQTYVDKVLARRVIAKLEKYMKKIQKSLPSY